MKFIWLKSKKFLGSNKHNDTSFFKHALQEINCFWHKNLVKKPYILFMSKTILHWLILTINN